MPRPEAIFYVYYTQKKKKQIGNVPRTSSWEEFLPMLRRLCLCLGVLVPSWRSCPFGGNKDPPTTGPGFLQ